MQVKDLHIDYAEFKDEASVVDNGEHSKRTLMSTMGESTPIYAIRGQCGLLLIAAIGSSNARVSAIGLEFELHGTDFPREAA